MESKDSLGDRMKRDYEFRSRYFLPRRTYTLVRIDGKSFHRYTRDCARPYDLDLMADMDETARALCTHVEGARCAFVQSDEISLLLTDFGSPRTQAYFDGNLQKICSITASIATAHFNRARARRTPGHEGELACFDSRVWTIPQEPEVFHYFLWRQQDASKNSITMTARAYFSHTRLHARSSAEMQEMLFREHGVNWSDLPVGFKRGRFIERIAERKAVTYTDKRTGEHIVAPDVLRHEWRVVEPPLFSQNREWLLSRLNPGEKRDA